MKSNDKSKEKRKTLKQGIILAVIILIVPGLIGIIVNNTGHDIEDVRTKMEDHLYEKYGEEFVVGMIGTRMFGDTEFYQATIYPKSIIETNREDDDYYYAEVNVDKLSFGRLRKPGDTYGKVLSRLKCEEVLVPKINELFGQRVRVTVGLKHYRRNENGYMVGYLTPNFDEALSRSINNPENNRLEIYLSVYIFDRIETEEEMERRREETFEFVQYLKEESLYEYLELGVIFIDERVLAPGYDNYALELRDVDKEEVELEGKTVVLPSMELRERMSKQLQAEIEQMSEQQLLIRMRSIRKSDLSYGGIGKSNCQYQSRIYSIGMIEENYSTTFETNPDIIKKYDDLKDVILAKNLEYIYVN